MIKKFLLWISLVFLMAFALFSGEALLMQRSLAEKTLRLHVVANSDSIEDQKQKLRVRDLVLEEVHSLTSKCNTFTETREKLRDHLAGLAQAWKPSSQHAGEKRGVAGLLLGRTERAARAAELQLCAQAR